MVIKLKSKYRFFIVFIISVYMLGLTTLAVSDLIKNRSYLKTDTYFTSSEFKSEFKSELRGYAYNIRALNGIYKDYSLKSDDYKVTEYEVTSSKTVYDSNLQDREYEIYNKYQYSIDEAKNLNNIPEVNRLIEAKNKELEEMKIKNTKTLEDLKKEIVAYKNEDYENIKSAISETAMIKYYITNAKNTVINTNIEDISDIDKYVKDNALYSIKFSEESLDKNTDEMFPIDQLVSETSGELYFIVPKDIDKNSSIYENYNYYNSVKERLIKEMVIAIVSLVIGLPILIYLLKKKKDEITILQKGIKWYKKVPLDLKIFIFLIYLFIMKIYLNNLMFFYKPYEFTQIYSITIVAVYIFYLIKNVQLAIDLKRNKEGFREVIKKSLLNRLLRSHVIQSDKFKILLTLLLGVSTMGIVIWILLRSSFTGMIAIASMAYILCYMIFMLFYISKIGRFFSRLTKGTEEIVSGNLNYTIEEKGSGDLLKIAHNINNMKAGFKKSLENEIKSERLKSELITNVSHDLKTPLTSIINYVDLLKKEDITKEETQSYIEVLERKSQRLKTLIDDLFEASKMASGAVEFNMEKVDVTALLKQTLAELDGKINESSLIFRLKMPEEKVYANLDGKRTWRVFENLINNALKYSQPNSRVYIDLIEENKKIIIIIKNMASYEMDFDNEEIFERFKRGDKSRNTEGSGLGLSIAKSILELQGGSLSIEIDGDLFKAKVIIPSIDLPIEKTYYENNPK
ncbi:HAMP domain-containing sensor histidine kinase [Clostridium vincentii]|uniref:histidine kinase n=1 Tax=Clostridium vincentii TaxID=52704 RepID=A0A2T0BIK8_9CLOT|nr:HAMP domain-containing sensor histidine kinase [Clostridium vincentii]PRR83701.1 Alkaline phosphatase synthesis sensor protein PhoR [Clostridium vincentii]